MLIFLVLIFMTVFFLWYISLLSVKCLKTREKFRIARNTVGRGSDGGGGGGLGLVWWWCGGGSELVGVGRGDGVE